MITFLQIISDALGLFVLLGEIHILVVMPFEQYVSAANRKNKNKLVVKNVVLISHERKIKIRLEKEYNLIYSPNVVEYIRFNTYADTRLSLRRVISSLLQIASEGDRPRWIRGSFRAIVPPVMLCRETKPDVRAVLFVPIRNFSEEPTLRGGSLTASHLARCNTRNRFHLRCRKKREKRFLLFSLARTLAQ